jgi:hypothetical protein
MLAYQDFVPKQLKAPHFGLSTDALQGSYETLDTALAAANQWVRERGVTIVNVETVVLPNLWANWEQGSADPVLGAGTNSPLWYQFIRVWYETCG